MPKKLSKNDFIERCMKIHGDKYDYSLVEYKNNKSIIDIICKIHGTFKQRTNNHLQGSGCPKCKNNQLSNNEDFTNNAKIIHDNKYDYSLVNYKNNKTKVNILCKIHGLFQQTPNSHLSKHGCPLCNKYTKELFIKKSIEIHGNIYDYSLVKYINSETEVDILCDIHGIFNQLPYVHLKGHGCSKCRNDKFSKERSKTTNIFIKESIKIHRNVYDYSNVNYKNRITDVKIICLKHGEFNQKPFVHLSGSGCPVCNSSKSEKIIYHYLIDNKIKFKEQKKFDNCRYINCLPFDFYLTDYNICIEYDGRQHFEPIDIWGGEKYLQEIKRNDKIKTDYCNDNNIRLIRISYECSILEELDKLKKAIITNGF